MDEEHVGTKELTEMVDFVIALGMAVDKSLADGHLDMGDAFNLYPVLQAAPAAFADANKIPTEIEDLSDDEFEELMNHVQEEFDIADDALEEVLERAFNIMTNLTLLVFEIRDMKKGEVK